MSDTDPDVSEVDPTSDASDDEER